MPIHMGARYKFVSHPSQPVGITKAFNSMSKEILVEWEDKDLIPPQDLYAEDMFSNGNFEFLGWSSCPIHNIELEKVSNVTPGCYHDWMSYKGLFEKFEFCRLCDKKRNYDKT